jgi:hypothetical protein
VCEKRGIASGEPFGIFEMTPNGEERFLDPEERMLDLIAYWQRLFEEERAKGEDAQLKKDKKKALGNNFYKVVFKVHMYFDPVAEDFSAQHEMYIQAVYDVVCARYPCGPEDCFALAALHLQAACGDSGLENLKESLSHFLPSKLVEGPKVDTAAVVAELQKQHLVHKGKSRQAAEMEFLAYVREWQVYGSSFFHVEPQMNVELPPDVFLAVNPKAILIINAETKEVRRWGPFQAAP